jgi:cell division transport system permease protein
VAQTLIGDRQAERVVPPTGHTAWLTVLVAAAMAFLAVFALALSLAASRLADRWAEGLVREVTLRLPAAAGPADRDAAAAKLEAAMAILAGTPGILEARPIERDEQAALLAPWLGPDLPLDRLPLPRLVEIRPGPDFDAEGLRLRLAAELPDSVLDDHDLWRAPLVEAAGRLRLLGSACLLLIGAVLAAMVTLAAKAALAASGPVMRVLRLVGARDVYAVRAFTRRFTLRTALGSSLGTAAGMLVLALLPAPGPAGGFLAGLGLAGIDWLLPLLIPPFAGAVAFAATRHAAFRVLARVA